MGRVTLQRALAGPEVQAMIDRKVAAGIDEALAGRVRQIALSEARRQVTRLRAGGSSRALLETAQTRAVVESRRDACQRWAALIGTPPEPSRSTALQLLESLSEPREQAPRRPAWEVAMRRRGVSDVAIAALGGALLEAPADAEDTADGGKDEASEDGPKAWCGKCHRTVTSTPAKECPQCTRDLSKVIAAKKRGGA